MRRAFFSSLIMLSLVLLSSFSTAGCRSAADTNRSETQSQFGVRMARMNLWREAMFRFRRAIEIDPQDAQAHNNLAVALEANGDFEAAAKEYREALRLDRTNQHIQKNYSRFVEFTQKSKKREAAATTAAGGAATTTPTVTDTTATDTATTDTAVTTTTTTNPPDGGSR